MTRTEYNQRVITRKKRSILIKGSLGIAAFFNVRKYCRTY